MTYIIYKKMDIDERYINGKIYKIVCNETGEVYYGSTLKILNARISGHRNNNSCISKQIINRNNYYYELIENYSCNNRYELETRERWYIENNACINKKIPTRTDKEYYDDSKEKRLEYYENNKEIINEKNRIYYHKTKEKRLEKIKEKITCDICGSIVRKDGIKRHQRGKKCLKKTIN